MKKWKKLFAVTAVTALVFAMAACGNKETSADPTEAPNPTEAAAEPTKAPATPTEAPAEPTEVPAEPTQAPTEPTEAPTEPTEAPAEPTEVPAEPTEPTAEPTEPTAEPTEPTAEPTAEPTKAPAAPTQAPAGNDTVINFVDLTAGGYGYEAVTEDDGVNVTIASQYQEIQYVLPEAVDLAQYSLLIVDVTSNSQLDIKLVNPDAELNEYNQATPFKDNYTAEGTAITEPVYIDLAGFADYDLSQINFMAMANDTAFRLNSMTFVKAEGGSSAETPAPTPTPEPTQAPESTEDPSEPADTPEPTEAPVNDNNTINFADLMEGGYGYEATVADGVVKVTISAQYQELQYVLPEAIDLAQYKTLIVDVVSNSQLDIKLVNPEAELNQYGQASPFADCYTAEGTAITEPVYIDLANYADYDLSQINFMAMVNDCEFTLNNMTFVK